MCFFVLLSWLRQRSLYNIRMPPSSSSSAASTTGSSARRSTAESSSSSAVFHGSEWRLFRRSRMRCRVLRIYVRWSISMLERWSSSSVLMNRTSSRTLFALADTSDRSWRRHHCFSSHSQARSANLRPVSAKWGAASYEQQTTTTQRSDMRPSANTKWTLTA